MLCCNIGQSFQLQTQIDLSKHFVKIMFKSALMWQLTRSFLLIYLYCRVTSERHLICCVANNFHIAEDLGTKLKHSSDYLVCLTNMLQSGNFTLYLIGTYWAQWLEHARKFKTKWHCWKLVCVHCCVAIIKLIIWMSGVFIIYVM